MPDTSDQRRLKSLLADVEQLRKFVDKLTLAKLARLVELERFGPENDSMPGGGGSDGGRSSDETTAVEAAALRGLPMPAEDAIEQKKPVLADDWRSHRLRDPIGEALKEMLHNLAEASGLVKIATTKLEVIDNAADALRGRQTSIMLCTRCGDPVTGIGEDRLRRGYDAKCYNAWKWAKFPERMYRPDGSFDWIGSPEIEVDGKPSDVAP